MRPRRRCIVELLAISSRPQRPTLHDLPPRTLRPLPPAVYFIDYACLKVYTPYQSRLTSANFPPRIKPTTAKAANSFCNQKTTRGNDFINLARCSTNHFLYTGGVILCHSYRGKEFFLYLVKI